jgi:hypothetical protein
MKELCDFFGLVAISPERFLHVTGLSRSNNKLGDGNTVTTQLSLTAGLIE